MLYFLKSTTGALIEVTDKYPGRDVRYSSRSQWGCLAEAKAHAYEATKLTGTKYMPIDHGPNRWPQYDVIEAPVLGALVSKAFNGDYYPCGTIAKISLSGKKITTSTGHVFWRRQQSGSWVSGGTWSMVQGHHTALNPHF